MRFGISHASVLEDLRDPAHGMPLLEEHVLKLEPEGTVPDRPRLAQLPNGPIDMRLFD